MSDEHDHGHDEHEHHAVNYTLIFGFLCVCTLLSIIFDLLKEQLAYPVLLVLIMGVAVSKATFVLLYFMHIKFERAWKYVLLAPTAVLACALPFALAPDIAFHYYNVAAPQREIAAAEHHGAPGHATEGHGEAAHAVHGAHDDHAAPGHDHKDEKKTEKLDGEHDAHPPAEKTSK